METEPQGLNLLYTALAKANANFPPIPRSRTVKVRMKSGGFYSFSYAPLEKILELVRKPLAEQGLALLQRITTVEAKPQIETQLVHQSGQAVGNLVPVLVLDTGPQAYNSALTYARRAGVTLLLCLAPEEDDDGNAAEGQEATDEEGQPLEREERVTLAQLVVDKEQMAEYVKRIKSAVDNQDPKGALILYRELNQLEKDYVWPLLAGKVGNTERTYRGMLRQARGEV